MNTDEKSILKQLRDLGISFAITAPIVISAANLAAPYVLDVLLKINGTPQIEETLKKDKLNEYANLFLQDKHLNKVFTRNELEKQLKHKVSVVLRADLPTETSR